MDQRARDDQMIGKVGYIPAPSPAPPLDGSYYNMNSDRYLSYPPMDYPPMEFTTPPLPIGHLPNTIGINSNGVIGGIGGGGTLRRGQHRGLVPPPDVTHHTAHTKSTHDLHNANSSLTPNGSQQQILGNLSQLSQVSSSTPKQPQGILKDPKRINNQQHNNVQILNVQNAPGIGNSLMVGGYDPTTTNLSTFNTTMGYTDADGHLV